MAAWIDVFAVEVNEGQLIRENDSVRVEQTVSADGSHVWYGTVNGICIVSGYVEVTVTDSDGADHQVDADSITVNETQGW